MVPIVFQEAMAILEVFIAQGGRLEHVLKLPPRTDCYSLDVASEGKPMQLLVPHSLETLPMLQISWSGCASVHSEY